MRNKKQETRIDGMMGGSEGNGGTWGAVDARDLGRGQREFDGVLLALVERGVEERDVRDGRPRRRRGHPQEDLGEACHFLGRFIGFLGFVSEALRGPRQWGNGLTGSTTFSR